ncbi:hypothetical protein VKT23_013761 [Stygiomarasmius scandens]|uniref:Uncharacterized protein n=1 Tax=Marasmiellus scandens TaxID=2682957 RepID=A0ABR1J2K1_9AGAR
MVVSVSKILAWFPSILRAIWRHLRDNVFLKYLLLRVSSLGRLIEGLWGAARGRSVRSITRAEKEYEQFTKTRISASYLPNGHCQPEENTPQPPDTCLPSSPSHIYDEQQVIPMLTDEYQSISPMAPEMYRRYEDIQFAPDQNVDHVFFPLMRNFQGDQIPEGWTQLVHPEGARYFCYKELQVYTDADVLDERTRRYTMRFIKKIGDFLRKHHITLSSPVNLVLDIEQTQEGRFLARYYFADHSKRAVFWLDKFEANGLFVLKEVKGVTSLSHIGLEIEAQYWHHCYLFPDCLELSNDLLEELRKALVHAISDGLTSMTSPVPYRTSELEQWLNLVKNLGRADVAAFSRLMHIFCRHRFRHFYGQPTARLHSERSIYKAHNKNSWLMLILSPLLFSAPDGYYRRLDKSYVDGIINQRVWADFWTEISTEWNQLIILGTVVLNANVAFLAIQSVDNATTLPERSAAQICSYLSVIASIGGILFGLFLTRTTNVNPKKAAVNAEFFINSATWAEKTDIYLSGVEKLAILYCTPYLLSMWSILLFLAGFTIMCLKGSDHAVNAIVGSAWFIIAIVIIWGISNLSVWKRYEWKEMSFWGRVVHVISIIPVRTIWPWKWKSGSDSRPKVIHRDSSMRWDEDNGPVEMVQGAGNGTSPVGADHV